MSNTQHKLDKARPPRVQITYDLEIGDAQTTKELPLVIGVLGDFTCTQDTLRDRKFLNIDKDNFNEIMSSMKPGAEFLVDSVLPDKDGQLAIKLAFNTIDDFLPDNIAQQIEPLKQLVEIRQQLSELRNRVASNDSLKEELLKIARQNVKEPDLTETDGEEAR